MNQIILKSLLIWAGIIPLAIINGALREAFSVPYPISGVILMVMIFIMAYTFIPRLGHANTKTYIKMGLVWCGITIVFETIFGLAIGMTLSEILHAYDITTGNLWLLVVIFVAIVPWLVMHVRYSNKLLK